MKLNRIDEALTCFNKALEINSGLIDAWIYKGRSLEELGEFDEQMFKEKRIRKVYPITVKLW
jgi:tetratricopeptide (TPR) repeat protein